MRYNILRPPLSESFELPSRNELLKLRAGDLVKLRFQVGEENPERMWVILEDCTNPDEWLRAINNNASQPETAKSIPAGTSVKFHPLTLFPLNNHRVLPLAGGVTLN